jgi:hypothetical protein
MKTTRGKHRENHFKVLDIPNNNPLAQEIKAKLTKQDHTELKNIFTVQRK